MRRNVLKISIAGALSVALVFATAALAETIRGTQGDNDITGTEGPDKIVAKKGDDKVTSLGGDDRVGAGRGDDTVNAGDGNDFLNGGQGRVSIIGVPGDDFVKAWGDGNRADTIDCGEGFDTAIVDRNDTLTPQAGCELVEPRVGNSQGPKGPKP